MSNPTTKWENQKLRAEIVIKKSISSIFNHRWQYCHSVSKLKTRWRITECLIPSFLYRNGSRDFLNKQKNLSDVLDSAGKKKKTIVTSDEFMELEQISNKRKRKETKHYRGKESLFKEPVDLPLRFTQGYKVPDFQKNPHKWTKYSLADITQNEMSNESNTAAALSFLREIKIHKMQHSVKMEVTDPEKKVIPSCTHQFSLGPKIEEHKDESHKPVFKSSKLIMPEYVVGQAKKIIKSSEKKIPSEKGKEIYLNHIHEYDDE